jgi:O6-methylguanine-DNA--protein-cysteine methyltransferase
MTIEQHLSGLATAAPSRITDGVMLGTGLVDGFAEYDSPIGVVVVAFNPLGVSAVDLADDGAAVRFEARHGRKLIEARPPRGWDAAIERAIERGTPGALPVDFRGVTEFQRSVLAEAAHIPRGQVRSYGWLADHVGNPGAVRTAASAITRSADLTGNGSSSSTRESTPSGWRNWRHDGSDTWDRTPLTSSAIRPAVTAAGSPIATGWSSTPRRRQPTRDSGPAPPAGREPAMMGTEPLAGGLR